MSINGRRVFTVLRSGGEFGPEHVQAMQRQVARWAPKNTEFVCLSDVDVPGVNCIPLWHNWPGWWSKIELFRPGLGDTFLFTDLDNVILGPMDDLFGWDTFIMQRGGWTALMNIPGHARDIVWQDFIRNPVLRMEQFSQANKPKLNAVGNYGDAGFISAFLSYKAKHWEDMFPQHIRNITEFRVSTPLGPRWGKLPSEVHVMLCGQPYRPWSLPMFRNMGLYKGEVV